MTSRLSLATLGRVPAPCRPRVDPAALGVGIVHLGMGAFHRAHQAEFTEDAVAIGGGTWGICGVAQHSRTVVDQLAPQDGLYSVVTPDAARVVGTVREVMRAADDHGAVVRRIADPAVRIVTLTVSEKGYRHDPVTRRLRTADPLVAADASGEPPRTVIGQVVRGIQARMQTDAGPLAVVSCDNLTANGEILAGLARAFTDLLPPAEREPLAAWIATQVSFPNTVVDRIVPAVEAAHRADARRLIGLDDAGAVFTEPYRQWVIEDDFPDGRPAWERAGAVLTDDVGPYSELKLRVLNGVHSMLAYLGAVAGCETIADALAIEPFSAVANALVNEDVRPTLVAPQDIDLDAYTTSVFDRLRRRSLRHRCAQVAADGSQKLPQRLVTTLRDRRAAGGEPRWAAFAVAAWMRWVASERVDTGSTRTLDDPLADSLRSLVAPAHTSAEVVDRLLGVRAVFGADLVDDRLVRELITEALSNMTTHGAVEAARILMKEGS